MDTFYKKKISSNYCLQLDGYRWSNSDPDRYTIATFITGDTVTMQVDFDLKQIIYFKNGKSLGVAFKDIDVGLHIKYKMAVRMADVGNKIQLTDFKCVNRYQHNFEVKKQAELSAENTKLKNQIKESQQILQSTIANASVIIYFTFLSTRQCLLIQETIYSKRQKKQDIK